MALKIRGSNRWTLTTQENAVLVHSSVVWRSIRTGYQISNELPAAKLFPNGRRTGQRIRDLFHLGTCFYTGTPHQPIRQLARRAELWLARMQTSRLEGAGWTSVYFMQISASCHAIGQSTFSESLRTRAVMMRTIRTHFYHHVGAWSSFNIVRNLKLDRSRTCHVSSCSL